MTHPETSPSGDLAPALAISSRQEEVDDAHSRLLGAVADCVAVGTGPHDGRSQPEPGLNMMRRRR